MANRHLSRVLSSDYLHGLADWPDDELRARRSECHQLEEAASYLRRLTQVRLDIIGAELDARRHPHEPSESVVDRLKRILAGSATPTGVRGRLMIDEPRDDQEAWANARIDEASHGVSIEGIGSLNDAALAQLTDGLAELERQVSTERHNLHKVYDAIQAELVQRYKTGRVSVDGLLK